MYVGAALYGVGGIAGLPMNRGEEGMKAFCKARVALTDGRATAVVNLV